MCQLSQQNQDKKSCAQNRHNFIAYSTSNPDIIDNLHLTLFFTQSSYFI